MSTLIDRESAEKVLTVLTDEGCDTEAVVAAMANVLARKLDWTSTPLPTGEHTIEKLERFFDVLFNVAFERKPLATERVIELTEKAAAEYRERADEAAASEDVDDREYAPQYEEDARAYEEVASLLRAGNVEEAVAKHAGMDTYTRGALFSNDPREQYELSVFLGRDVLH
jgi:hypothetical protein